MTTTTPPAKTVDTNTVIRAYTDGACSGNPGPGGWGFVLARDDKRLRRSGGEKQTTNQRMELTAAIKALEELKGRYPNNPISVYTDSTYVRDGITKLIVNWKKNGWRKSNRTPVLNADLWRQLDTLNEELSVTWEWVKGHAGHKENEEADALAKQATPRKQNQH